MNNNIIYVEIDVDDQSFHGTALIPTTGEVADFNCRPNVKGFCNLLQILREKFPQFEKNRKFTIFFHHP